MAVWIESHIDIGEHPKTYRLSSALKVRQAEAVGLLHLLWHFSMKWAWRDGDLSKFDNASIARGCKWKGDADSFIGALKVSGWLDDMKVHDWQDFAGKLIRDRLYAEERRRGKSTTVGDKRPKKGGKSGNPDPTQTLPNPTQPGTTVAAVPQNQAPQTDIQKIVTVYKMVTGYPKEDPAWDKLNFARCAKSAKALLDFIGNWKDAGYCVEDVYQKLSAKGFTVTLETVVKHAADWKKDQQERGTLRGGILPVPSNGSLPTH